MRPLTVGSLVGPCVGDLAERLARGEFRLDYQPIRDLRSGEVALVEALIRWDHPELGHLLPGAFLGSGPASWIT